MAEGAVDTDKLERDKLDFEKKKFEVEHSSRLRERAVREGELKIQEQKHNAKEAEKQSFVLMVKRYGEAIRASVTPMGPDVLEVVSFFKRTEVVFDQYEVPPKLEGCVVTTVFESKSSISGC